MKILQLNFSDIKQRKRRRSNLIVVILLLLLMIGMVVEQGHIDKQITEIEDTIAKAQGRQTAKQAKPTEQDLRKMKIAGMVQEKLNFPWPDLLTAIEIVKQQASTLNLMTIQPNPANNEVLISAQSPNLEAMLSFVSLLEQQPVFHDVLLINQRRLESDGGNGLAFTLKMDWEI